MKMLVVNRKVVVSIFVMLVLLCGFQGVSHVAEAFTVPTDPAFSDLVAAQNNGDDDLFNELLNRATRLCAGLEFPRDTFAVNEEQTILFAHRPDGTAYVFAGGITFVLSGGTNRARWYTFGKQGDVWVLSSYAPDGVLISCTSSKKVVSRQGPCSILGIESDVELLVRTSEIFSHS